MPHLLYGHVPARDVYSVGRWRTDAIAALEQARAMNRVPIFCGGTGMYFGVLTDGLADIPATPQEIRDAARALLDDIGVEALHAKLS
ncbi:MAG: tRNA (adenosine(37)-N6)-dimethylallyltransferase MiaA, partial [Proteobacteria bacterium]